MSAEAALLAKELRELRPRVLAAFAAVNACHGCAKGRSEPHGHWSGGFCCGGRTDGVFDDHEVAALALGGTRPGDLQAPPGDHAGCAFRGPEGCSLDARDRPNLCVRFVCRELEAELREDGAWPAVRALTRELETTFARFVKAIDGVAASATHEALTHPRHCASPPRH
jgi:choline dehydrogenase-like flavoprotein